MPQDEMTTMVTNWRRGIKEKHRASISLEERIENRLEAIKGRSFKDCEILDDWQIRQARYLGPGQYEYLDADWRPLKIGDPWGDHGISAFFRRSVDVPKRFAGEKVVLRMYIGGDSLLSINGKPFHGLDPFRNEVCILLEAKGDEHLDIDIESYFTWHSGEASGEAKGRTLFTSQLVSIDKELESAYYDLLAVYKLLEVDDLSNSQRDHIEVLLTDLINKIDPREPDQVVFKSMVIEACVDLQSVINSTSPPLDDTGLLTLTGHSHLDVIFMWQYKEFIRKVGRTHATAMRLLEQHPQFIMSQSQALTYYEMKRHFPDLFERVKGAVKEGRWEVCGTSWIEWDGNLPSGESYVRQILFGRKFFKDELDVVPDICWQPDIFGMTWTLPQILVRSGIKYAVTHKLSAWNDTNPWKKNAFWWQGPDGSRIFTVIPVTHFIGMNDPDHLYKSWSDFSEKQQMGELFYTFGWGDGGGGPDNDMIEVAKRYNNVHGLLRTEFGTIGKTLQRMRDKAADLSVWDDELYLEAHRGVYTTKGTLKKLNRYAENLYRQAELFSAVNWSLFAGKYPAQKLAEGWQNLLTNQFHDTLPGSHITLAYGDILAEYDQILATGESVEQDALVSLAQQVDTSAQATGKSVVVFNSLLHERSDPVKLDASATAVADERGNQLPCQQIIQLDGEEKTLFSPASVPAVGYATYSISDDKPKIRKTSLQATTTALSNQFFEIELNEFAEIVSLHDRRHDRAVIAENGLANKLRCYEDMSGIYDAWDIVASYPEHELDIHTPVDITVDEQGPVRASVLFTKKILNSTMRQRISIYEDYPAIDFETEVDWHEDQKLLKVGFDLNVLSRHATYDIAYGNIDRPNHRNNSYDAAKFEVPAHYWMDMSQADYGVSLINDCKYGHEAYFNTIRLTLLRSPMRPDPTSDRGINRFTYRLLPHAGDWRSGGTICNALELNVPAKAVAKTGDVGNLPPTDSFLSCDSSHVTLEAFKQSEDGTALVLRFVERHRTTGNVTLTFAKNVRCAKLCNLMEVEEQDADHNANTVTFPIKPYEIKTLKLSLA